MELKIEKGIKMPFDISQESLKSKISGISGSVYESMEDVGDSFEIDFPEEKIGYLMNRIIKKRMSKKNKEKSFYRFKAISTGKNKFRIFRIK